VRYGRSGKFFALFNITAFKTGHYYRSQGDGQTDFLLGGLLITRALKLLTKCWEPLLEGNHLACAAGLAIGSDRKGNLIENLPRRAFWELISRKKPAAVPQVRE